MSKVRIALGIRAQLLLVLTVFLAIPWLGYEYVRELERFLRDAQQKTLAGTAQAVATALHDRPRLFDAPAAPRESLVVERSQDATVPDPAAPLLRATAPLMAEAAPAEIAQIVQGLSRTTARIFVIDRELNVLARAGSLKRPSLPDEQAAESGVALAMAGARDPASALRAGAQAAERGFRRRAGRTRRAAGEGGRRSAVGDPDRRPATDARRQGRRRLGRASDLGRRSGQGRGDRRGDDQRGARRAQPRVRASFFHRPRRTSDRFAGTDALCVAAVRTAHPQVARRGRSRHRCAPPVRGVLEGSNAGDEIGDLSRSFSSVLSRLAQYASYRQNMASRLSHELRTPVAVVEAPSTISSSRRCRPTRASTWSARNRG